MVGNGVGIVALKRLEDALEEGDHIYSVIKGSAINNDGASKVGFTAPSVAGQASAIKMAQSMAEIQPETISYVEAHGTGTILEDPIEIRGLIEAFDTGNGKTRFCSIGSVKTNVGHLNTAAGVTGLIKTALALKYQELPPSLHYTQPNPNIDFDNSPFYVNTTLSPWHAVTHSRRAGVSSFGMGGTNSHVVLEEAPPQSESSGSRPWQILVLSAKTQNALALANNNMVQHLKRHPDLSIADVAYTLQVGRREFEHREAILCRDLPTAVTAFEGLEPTVRWRQHTPSVSRSVVFMFPGQGTQYINMSLGLYKTEPTFRETLDTCLDHLTAHVKFDLRAILFPQTTPIKEASHQLTRTAVA